MKKQKEYPIVKLDIVFMEKDGIATFHITPHGFFKKNKEYECSGKVLHIITKHLNRLQDQIDQALILKPEDACKIESHE